MRLTSSLIQTVDGRRGRSARSSSHVSSYGAPTRHVSTRFGRGLRRRGFRLTAAVKRLEHEAAEGASARTPAILVAAMAIGMWALAAILIATALIASSLLAH